jgi:hypothetical protein
MLIALAYVAIVMPFNISFVDDLPMTLQVVEHAIDAFFIFDLFYNLLTAYREDDILVTSNRKIVVKYCRGWFLFDIVASFPFSDVINAAIQSQIQADLVLSQQSSNS